ncbi:hypothetical protein E8E11_006703 [Didymella keratinophila]|nr:hypothetical protein E8E11_006703 [Didymella keratinophila]
MSDNVFSGGAAAGRMHPSVNNHNGYHARLDNTPSIEGYQGYTQSSRAYNDYQQSQGPGHYLPHVGSMCPEGAYSSELGIGHHPAQYQHIPQPQRSYQAMDAPSYQMGGHPQTRGVLDEQCREIGGQFSPAVDPSIQHGAWNIERTMQGASGMFSDENALAYSYEGPPVAGGGVRHHSHDHNANVSQLGSVDGQQQSMLMTSLGRRPGYQEELLRAMSVLPPDQMVYTSSNGTVNMSPSASAGDRDSALVIQLQERGSYPLLQQHKSGNSVVPGIVLHGSLTPASQPRGRSGPQLPGRWTPSSSSVVIGDALRCSHEGCEAEFKKSWGKGNLARHIRNKHKNGGRCYICEADGCASVFQRSDARLRHYRKEHQGLVKRPSRPREASSSTGTGSVGEHLGGSPYSNSLASPNGSQALDDFETVSSSCEIDDESCHDSLFQPFS